MKRIVLILVSVFCMYCMVACGGEVKEDVSAGGNDNEVLVNSNDENVATEPTAEPTAKPTAEPTVEPTPSPEETLVSLREQAMGEYNLIVEHVQHRFDIALEILEVVKGYPNFIENRTYENIFLTKSLFEETIPKCDINTIVELSNALNSSISFLVEDYPELKETEEFKKLIEVPKMEIAFYNGRAKIYNSALSDSATSEFEELPYCSILETKIEY